MKVDLDYLKGCLQDNEKEYVDNIKVNSITNRDIAVIGISCKFAQANNKEEYWHILENGKSCIRAFPENRKNQINSYAAAIGVPEKNRSYYKAGFLDEVDKFDYVLFGISPAEASLMSPEQRLFLETAWSSIEDAGYGGKKIIGTKTGVYVGHSTDFGESYKAMIEATNSEFSSISIPANMNSIIASRISYLLDLKGPSLLIDTACSSALTSIHVACSAIRNGECDMAIAGAVKVDLLPLCIIKQREEELGTATADGITRTFDEDSKGPGLGEGVAAVLLKPFDRAVKDRDNIYAVIKGTAINQDGKSVGLTAPNSAAQEEVILSAWRDAKINPETITYIETHGTGTKLGDPIEISGIQRAFRKLMDKRQFCAVGSSKTNLGHLDNAAGMAAFIKAILSLNKKKIPPTINFNKPNKNINFIDSPVFVNDRLREWNVDGFPRRCGVSAFGLSGTNCHIVLEETPIVRKDIENNGCNNDTRIKVLTMSAKSKCSLIYLTSQYVRRLVNEPDIDLNDLCYTANTSRGQYTHRLAIVFTDYNDLLCKLNYLVTSKLSTLEKNGTYYGEYKIIASDRPVTSNEEITDEELRNISISVQSNLIKKHDTITEEERKYMLDKLCIAYVKGVHIDWEELYKFHNHKKLSLPCYPFEKKTCWIDIQTKITVDTNHADINKNLYHRVTWREKAFEVSEASMSSGTFLIISAEEDAYKNYLQLIREQVNEVVEVVYGEEFIQRNDGKYTINGTEEDYTALFDKLKHRNITKIIYLATETRNTPLNTLMEYEEEEKKGVYSLFFIIKALLNNKYRQKLDIIILADYANEVTGNECAVNPHHAALFGISKVIGQEYDKFECRCIDFDRYTNEEIILNDIKSCKQEHIAAYRKGIRYVEELQPTNLDSFRDVKCRITNEGVYIVLGGMGAIGLEVCRFLASKNKVNIALINRTPFPERESWEGFINKEQDIEICEKIKTIKELEKNGSKILLFSADISDLERMSVIISELRQKYQRINGVMNCAGVAGDGFIIIKNIKRFESVIKPKMQGTWVLDKLTQEDELDFFITLSSISSFLSEAGQSDYTAANCYLDAYSNSRRKAGRRTLTINWTAWKEIGMAVKFDANKEDDVFKPITTADAMNAFEQVLNRDIDRIIIGQLDLTADTRISKLLLKMPDTIKKKNVNEEKTASMGDAYSDSASYIQIIGEENKGLTEIEGKTAQIWAKALKLEKIDVYQKFFDMGGNSILASNLIRMMEKEFPGVLDITDIYTYPTVLQISKYIHGKVNSNKTANNSRVINYEDEIDELLDRLVNGTVTNNK